MSTSGAAPTGGPPTGAAGGDLGGVYPAPGVVGLQGRGVSAAAPLDAQGLVWNAVLGLWVPTTINNPAPSNLVVGPDAFGQVAAPGVAATFSRGDHDHGLPADPTPAFAVPAIGLATAAAAGVAGTVIRSDATIVAFDTTLPVAQVFGDVHAAGAAVVAARRDHRHGMPAAPVTSFNGRTGAVVQANGYGITGADLNPPVPAVSFTDDVQTLGADTAIAASTTTTILTTAALGIGTWDVSFGALILWGATNVNVDAFVVAGTATVAFAGQQAASGALGANNEMSLTIRCRATVTVAGTLLFRVSTGAAAGITVKAASIVSALPATGSLCERYK